MRFDPGSAKHSVAVNISSTDHDVGANLGPANGIYIGGAGALVCRLAGDAADVTFANLSAGVLYPFAVSIVRKTNTTATNMVAVWT